MKLKDILEQYGDMEVSKTPEEIKKLLGIKHSKVWKPKDLESYYRLNSTGCVREDYWCNNENDKGAYAIGNCFQTQEEAMFEVERLKVIAELKRYAIEHNEELDWNNRDQDKYYIFYNCEHREIDWHWESLTKTKLIHFSGVKVIRGAIEAIGEDRIKKYYLGVVED